MTTASPIRTDAAPFSDEQIAQYAETFERDGFCLIPGVLQPDEIEALKKGVDRIFADDAFIASHNRRDQGNQFVATRLFETDPAFEDMLTREPIISLVEKLLGDDCHLIAQNVVYNKPGESISRFHVDDKVIFPVPPGRTRHPEDYRLPLFILTIQIPLTDVDAMEYGPTEFVPGSHYSGRDPDSISDPTFEGRKAVPVLCKAGDMYLHNGQCWHRGAPNTSHRTRYLFQMAYAQRWISQRFYPFLNYRVPDHVLARADERRRRVLGAHPHGNYG